MGLERVRRFDLPSFGTGTGALTVIENLPFTIRRSFFINRVPEGGARGGHANRDAHVFVAVSGSFELFLDDGKGTVISRLDRPNEAVYVPPLIWRELRGFAADTTCLVFCSSPYTPDDYIRDYDLFLKEVRENAIDDSSAADSLRSGTGSVE